MCLLCHFYVYFSCVINKSGSSFTKPQLTIERNFKTRGMQHPNEQQIFCVKFPVASNFMNNTSKMCEKLFQNIWNSIIKTKPTVYNEVMQKNTNITVLNVCASK